jgi:hypothetical protein
LKNMFRKKINIKQLDLLGTATSSTQYFGTDNNGNLGYYNLPAGYDSTDFDNDLATKTTDDLDEGAVNKYFPEAPDGDLHARTNTGWVKIINDNTSIWGLISGNLSDQTDLQSALNSKSNNGHTHSASEIVSGTLADARIPSLAISKITNLQTSLDAKANNSITLTAGNGLTGGGNLTANRTFTMGTPSTIGNGSTNSVGESTHSHAINLVSSDIPSLDAGKITSGTFADARISAGSVTQHLGNYVDRTTAQDIGGIKNFTSNIRISAQGLLIGTTSIDANRSIQSVRSTSNILQFDSNAVRFLIEAGQEVNRFFSRNLSNGNAGFRIQIGTTDRLSIIPSGEVGINKVPIAGRALDVNGIVYATNVIIG